MTITAITGDIGSGKSHKQLKHALYCCNRYKKRLVTNFGVSLPAIKKYAYKMRYWWVIWLCDNDQITIFDLKDSAQLPQILSISYSVVCLDEAGIFLNTRDFQKTPKALLTDLAQSRKYGCDLIYAAQFDGQVDKQLRMLTQWFIHADGSTIWSTKLRNQKLVWLKYHTFTATKYWEWSENLKRRNSFIRTWWAAVHTEIGPLRPADVMLFDCFQSFARLDHQSAEIQSARTTFTSEELEKCAIKDTIAAAKYLSAGRRDRKVIDEHPQRWLSLSPQRRKRMRRIKNPRLLEQTPKT